MNIIKSLCTITLMTIATVAMAQFDKSVIITPVKDKQAVNVYIDLPGEVPYTVSLKNEEGENVWSEQWTKPVYAKSVMMKNLPEGNYAISVSADNKYVERSFTLDAQMARVSKGQRTILGPTVSVMGRSVFVDFDVNKGAEVDHSDVEVQIYDKYGDEVFANSITTDHGRITRYDMSALPAGDYEMIFSIEGQTFTRSVRTQ